MKTRAAIVLFIPLLTLVSNVLAREWTDKSGRFSTEAELVSVKDGTVTLKKPDGSVVSILIDRLSAADRAYLRAATRPTSVVTVSNVMPMAEVLKPNSDLAKLNTFKGGRFFRVRCTVTTSRANLTIGSKKGKKANSDLVEFKDFNLLYGGDGKAQAVAVGHGVGGPVALCLVPDDFANLVNVNKQKEYTWDIDVVFVVPKSTKEAKFSFRTQEPVSIEMSTPSE